MPTSINIYSSFYRPPWELKSVPRCPMVVGSTKIPWVSNIRRRLFNLLSKLVHHTAVDEPYNNADDSGCEADQTEPEAPEHPAASTALLLFSGYP